MRYLEPSPFKTSNNPSHIVWKSSEMSNGGREFIALYIFDLDGNLIEAKIDDSGTREQLNKDRAVSIIQKRLAELGDKSFQSINVAPFRIEKFGVLPNSKMSIKHKLNLRAFQLF